MTTTWTSAQLERWIDRQSVDKDGHRLGHIADVYVDDATGEPEWLAVVTGLFGSRISFVPLLGAEESGAKVKVAYAKSVVKDSPNIDMDGQLSEEEEERLYRHYGLTYRRNTEAPVAPLQEEGSASLTAEPSIEAAQTRLRKREQAAVEAIDLRSTDVDLGDGVDIPEVGSPEESTDAPQR